LEAVGARPVELVFSWRKRSSRSAIVTQTTSSSSGAPSARRNRCSTV